MLETRSRLLIRSYANDMQIAVLDHSVDNIKKKDWECSEHRQFPPYFQPVVDWICRQNRRWAVFLQNGTCWLHQTRTVSKSPISHDIVCVWSLKVSSHPGITPAVSFNAVLVLPSTLRMLIHTTDIYLCVHLCMESKEPTSFLPTWVSVADHLLNGQMANPRTPPCSPPA